MADESRRVTTARKAFRSLGHSPWNLYGLFCLSTVLWSLGPFWHDECTRPLVAHETLGAAGQRLLDDRMLNVVLVVVFATSVLGPMLTERFASRLSTDTRPPH
jgi:hypothetical protein